MTMEVELEVSLGHQVS